jgi:hypothetical protein
MIYHETQNPPHQLQVEQRNADNHKVAQADEEVNDREEVGTFSSETAQRRKSNT